MRNKIKSNSKSLLGASKEWDTAPRGEPATSLMSEWLKEGQLEDMVPPPTQAID